MNTLILFLIGLFSLVLIVTIALQSPKGGLVKSSVLSKNDSTRGLNYKIERMTWFAGSLILLLSVISHFV